MKVVEAPLQGILIIEPKVFNDSRGCFFESFRQDRLAEFGIPPFVQDNVSQSKRNVLRGLHYQLPRAQGKLIWVTRGTVWDVVVDIRKTSPTFGQWFATTLSEENHTQLYIPAGFAHGFCVLSEVVDFNYKCTDYYSPETERGIAWNDKDLNIPWPVKQPMLSPKDELHQPLNNITSELLFA